ncbi:microfibril-associated glycoprotein 4-like [Asterias rubens]|uniref:microfibril-associated glycoprotein 4-like n=1 Tax=Asterias rubens TaxID=7604 RepID=UPI001455BC53|nr:microfibril-associated glycoprotein 4-like [Asterias rubens]
MKYALLVLFACVVGLHGGHEKEKGGSSHEHQLVESKISQGVLSLIENAVKVAQYTKVAERQKALSRVQVKLEAIVELLESEELDPEPATTVYYKNCQSLLSEGFRESGVYDIYPEYPEVMEPMKVYCDQVTDGGGWIVFQRRRDGLQSFEKTWDEYAQGFGNLSTEFWLGNNNLRILTKPKKSLGSLGGNVVLRAEVTDWADLKAFSKYNTFTVTGDLYTLTAEDFDESSTAGDGLAYQTGMDFTTIDRDNDEASGGNCAEWMRGGFWFNYCHTANPNGPYLQRGGPYGAFTPGTDQGVSWTTYTGHGREPRQYSLKGTEMKLRREPEILQ